MADYGYACHYPGCIRRFGHAPPHDLGRTEYNDGYTSCACGQDWADDKHESVHLYDGHSCYMRDNHSVTCETDRYGQ